MSDRNNSDAQADAQVDPYAAEADVYAASADANGGQYYDQQQYDHQQAAYGQYDQHYDQQYYQQDDAYYQNMYSHEEAGAGTNSVTPSNAAEYDNFDFDQMVDARAAERDVQHAGTGRAASLGFDEDDQYGQDGYGQPRGTEMHFFREGNALYKSEYDFGKNFEGDANSLMGAANNVLARSETEAFIEEL